MSLERLDDEEALELAADRSAVNKGTKHVTIRVSRSALPAHLRHGDTVGACSSRAGKNRHGSKAHASKFHKTKGKSQKGKRGKGKKG